MDHDTDRRRTSDRERRRALAAHDAAILAGTDEDRDMQELASHVVATPLALGPSVVARDATRAPGHRPR